MREKGEEEERIEKLNKKVNERENGRVRKRESWIKREGKMNKKFGE